MRIALFLITNIAVLIVLSIISSLLGVDQFLTKQGLNPALLIGFAAVFGMGGSLISLLMSKQMALWSTGAQVIKQPSSREEAWLFEEVGQLARNSKIGKPDVAIYDSPEPNAFATGASRDNALVAVSTGLLQRMEPEEVRAVLAHEVAHVANGDMVTMALLQGVLNTFVIAVSRVVAYLVSTMGQDEEEEGGGMSFMTYFVVSMVAQVVFGMLASLVVMAFSRYREFRADAGAAGLVGPEPMIKALQRLRGPVDNEPLPQELSAFGIRGGSAFSELFSSHPPIERRIERLAAQVSN